MRFKRDRSIRCFLVLEAALYAFPGRGIITVRDSIRQLLTAACIAGLPISGYCQQSALKPKNQEVVSAVRWPRAACSDGGPS